ncbi:hypothetical protein MVEN_00944300 [Mycena venus]|uniref:Uncharacterized protein n=1 Tax=Mycena venus TaxID=2733690 RepID=A0A8H6YCU5_9AGAR|nr:hypothetical protein MVEN_00944300 [Mycena venus]
MNTLIPRPRWPPSKIKAGTVTDMLKAMPGWTEGEFHRFKEYVTYRANTFGLDTYAMPDNQDPLKWRKLLDDCRSKFSGLDDFEGHWPLEVYFTKWVYFRALRKKRQGNRADDPPGTTTAHQSSNSKKRKGPQQIEEDSEGEQSTSSNELSGVGHVSAPHQRTTQTSAARTSQNKRISPIAERSARSGETRSSLSTSQSKPSTFVPTSSPSSSAPPCTQRVRLLNARHGWDSCVLCGYQASVSAEATTQLKQCFKDRVDLLNLLATAGVIADHHFRALLTLKERHRTEFLRALASAGKVTYVEKIEIMDALETYLEKNPELTWHDLPRKIQLTAIPRPRAGLENLLAFYGCEYTNVKRHMQIIDDDEYFELVDLIDSKTPTYLDVSIPFEEQDEDKLDAFVALICDDKPSLRRYDDFWPVVLHVRRFLSARAAGLQAVPRELTTAGRSTTPHQCTKLRRYPPSDVPPSVSALLADYGMDELGPAFLFLGFASDAKFAEIVTSRRTKDTFLAGLPGRLLECSDFQSMMMRHIVERL